MEKNGWEGKKIKKNKSGVDIKKSPEGLLVIR
jgi:hypothetical protein